MLNLSDRQLRRLQKYVVAGPVNECWPWLGPMSSNGYGMFRVHGREYVAHRVVYEYQRGAIASHLVVDHLCRNPACVNVNHLQPVTRQVNTLRGVGPTATNATKTHCKHGHEFTEQNTLVRHRGRRECKQCRRDVRKARKQWRSGRRSPSTRVQDSSSFSDPRPPEAEKDTL